MFDRIAPRYDLLNRLMSLGLDGAWRRRLVRALGLRAGARVLDVATGTGDVAVTIAKLAPGALITGLDPSARMLRIAREKLAAAGAHFEGVAGSAEALPFADGAFDACSMAFGIRNVADRPRALAELARVTRPGGSIGILELGEPRSGLLAPLARLHIHQVVPRLGAWLSGAREYRYLEQSIAAFPAPDEFVALLERAGLARARAEPLGFGAVSLFVAESRGAS
jgi:demethylmenaquinone methyltransferase/2-methoxy-6-polyprenyl-1,4-benzoquinol methylase